MDVPIVSLPHFQGLQLPAYETDHAAGMDLRCAVGQAITLEPGDRQAIPTGIKIAVPPGFEGQVRPRSGLALKQGIGIINAPGTIDADYRGEILVPLINLGRKTVTITRGMRIAQLIIAPVQRISWRPVTSLEESARGEGGFGHTGIT